MRSRSLPTIVVAIGALGVALGLGLGLYLAGSGERGDAATADAPASATPAHAATLAHAPGEDTEIVDDGPTAARTIVAAGDATAAEVDFDPREVRGVVVDASGEPIEGASLKLFAGAARPRRSESPVATTTSGEDGSFRFGEREERRELRLLASAPAHATKLFLVASGVDETLELEPAAPLTGRVLDAESGAPVADVELSFRSDSWGAAGYSRNVHATSDEEGRFTFVTAPADAVLRLDIARPGHLRERRELQARPDRRDGYDVLIGSSPPLVLELVDAETGAPLGELDVELLGDISATTDAGGALELFVPSPERMRGSSVGFGVSADGYCDTRGAARAPSDGGPGTTRVPMLRGCTLTGVVRDADGALLAGADVRVVKRGGKRSPELEGSARWTVAELPNVPRGVDFRDANGRDHTGADGAFALSGVLAGPKYLVASAPDRPRVVLPIELDAPGTQLAQDLELARGAILEGVVTVDGEPESLRIRWSGEDGSGSGRSNDRGEYRLHGVTPGAVKLRASLPRGVDPPEPVEVHVADGETQRVDLTLVMNRKTIAGFVLDERGEPLGGISVSAAPEDESGKRNKRGARVETDPTGAFVLEVNGTGELSYTVTAADGPRWASQGGVLPGEEHVELELALLGRVQLTVLDERTQLPVPAFRLYWKHAAADAPYRMLWQSGREFEPGGDGGYLVSLPVGTLDLALDATKDDYAPEEVRNVIVLEEGEAAEVLVRLEPVPRVVLRFRAAEEEETRRRPPARRIELATDEQVQLLQRNDRFARLVVHRLQRVELNDRGDAVLRGIAPGSYTLRRSPGRLVFTPERLEVPVSAERRSFRVLWKDARAAAKENSSR